MRLIKSWYGILLILGLGTTYRGGALPLLVGGGNRLGHSQGPCWLPGTLGAAPSASFLPQAYFTTGGGPDFKPFLPITDQFFNFRETPVCFGAASQLRPSMMVCLGLPLYILHCYFGL